MSSLVIDTQKGRNTLIFDIPGAYLHPDMPEHNTVLLKIQRKFADIMCDVNLELKEHISYEKVRKVLYMLLLKALYGCMEYNILWYYLYNNTLKGMAFKLNLYDICVANNVANMEQCTLCWYVDNNKVSHMEDKVNTDIVVEISKHLGELNI